ncbi:MAG TPA: CHASE2 domain-containing protein, partial [Tepidisphaeraceae bacterium]|nr:CHASE2 domain-containing protein [Tepidisphaeraceae bacterium]
MTKTERALRNRLLALGLLLTLAVIALNSAGGLSWFEHVLDDRRTRWCQFFVPPPTDRLVHLDIDDSSLEYIGKWPWPRNVDAQIVDEIRRAGAKALAWDAIFPDATQASNPNAANPDNQFAAAIRRFGNVVMTVDFEPADQFQPKNAQQTAIMAALLNDPQMDLSALQQKLAAQGLPAPSADDYLTFLRRAISQRIAQTV